MGLYMDAPDPPDPKKTAQAQANANLQGAWTSSVINNPNQVTPYGTVTYDIADYSFVPQDPSQFGGGFIGGGWGGGPTGGPTPAPARRSSPMPGPTGRNADMDRRRSYMSGRDAPVTFGTDWSGIGGGSGGGGAGGGGFMGGWGGLGGGSSAKGYMVPRYTQTVKLSPGQQRIFDLKEQLGADMLGLGTQQMDRLAQTLNKPISFSGAPGLRTGYNTTALSDRFRRDANTQAFRGFGEYGTGGPTKGYSHINMRGLPGMRANIGTHGLPGLRANIGMRGLPMGQSVRSRSGQINKQYLDPAAVSKDRSRVERAVMSRGQNLLGESREAEMARLAAMGLTPGGEAYGRVSDQFERSSNDLAMQAVLAGGQEQSRLLGESRAAADFRNQAIAQMFGQDLASEQFDMARRGQLFGERAAENQWDAARRGQLFGERQAEVAYDQSRRGQLFGERQAQTNVRNQVRQMQEAAVQARNQFQMARTEAENARRRGDMQAYNNAVQQMNQARAMNAQMEQQQATFQNTARSQYINELMTERNQPLNEIIGFLGGTQVQAPQPLPYATQQTPGAPIGQYTYDSFNAKNNQYQNFMSGLMGLGQTGAGLALGFM